MSSTKHTLLQVRQTAEEKQAMTCPTCDKVFVARSILERHLKTSGHGGRGRPAADLQPQAPGPGMICISDIYL